MKSYIENIPQKRIPSSVYGEAIAVIESLSALSNFGFLGYVALMEADTTRPVFEIVTEHPVYVPSLQFATIHTLNPRDVRSMPRIQEVLVRGIRILGQTEQLAATVERLADTIQLAARESELLGEPDIAIPVAVEAPLIEPSI